MRQPQRLPAFRRRHTIRRLRPLRALAAAGAVLLAATVTACASPTGDTAAPHGDGMLVAFYGDSYTLGTGASDPSRRWSTIVSAQRGWREFNPSVNGLGYVNNRLPAQDVPGRIIAEDPDVVLVTMGLNDAFSFDRAGDSIRDAIRDDLARFRAELPDARLVVFEPFWYTSERPDAVETIIEWVHDAALDVDADWVAGPSHWLDGHYAGSPDSWMAADGLHPDDTGYAEIAVRVDAALRDLDPPL